MPHATKKPVVQPAQPAQPANVSKVQPFAYPARTAHPQGRAVLVQAQMPVQPVQPVQPTPARKPALQPINTAGKQVYASLAALVAAVGPVIQVGQLVKVFKATPGASVGQMVRAMGGDKAVNAPIHACFTPHYTPNGHRYVSATVLQPALMAMAMGCTVGQVQIPANALAAAKLAVVGAGTPTPAAYQYSPQAQAQAQAQG